MKMIHSFWSKPAFHNNQDYNNGRKFGGWPNLRYFLISSCFSCLTIKKYQKKIELITDTKGNDIFINMLDLPYSNVSLSLDQLKDEDHRLWIAGKVKAIQVQEESFIHLDNDVYLWQALPGDTTEKFLIAQSLISLPQPYKNSLHEVQKHFSYVPTCLQDCPDHTATVANVGIVGGNDMEFFRDFCQISTDLLEKNRDNLVKIDIGRFNQIMEEYLFTCLARERKYAVKYLIDGSADRNPLDSVLRFHIVPAIDKYIHLVGIAKQSKEACEQLELRLEYEFPEYYAKVNKIIEDSYPSLVNAPTKLLIARKRRSVEAIRQLYTKDTDKLMRLKVKLIDNAEIIEMMETNATDTKYGLKMEDPFTGEVVCNELKQTDQVMVYFTEPISMHELLEELVTQSGAADPVKFEQQKLKLFDIVTEKIVIDGVLEFIE